MLVRRLDNDWDMVFGHGLADYLKDSNAAIGQSIKSRLLLILGEWFLDVADGTPWQMILGRQRIDAGAIEGYLRARVQGTEGVVRITKFDMGINTTTRNSGVSLTVLTIYGTYISVTI